jgi:ABC-type phosphonate transport system ATPase subunit
MMRRPERAGSHRTRDARRVVARDPRTVAQRAFGALDLEFQGRVLDRGRDLVRGPLTFAVVVQHAPHDPAGSMKRTQFRPFSILVMTAA